MFEEKKGDAPITEPKFQCKQKPNFYEVTVDSGSCQVYSMLP